MPPGLHIRFLQSLGPLPLFHDDDGFYSVLGPPLCNKAGEDQVNGSTNHPLAYSPIHIPATLTPPRDKVFCGSLEGFSRPCYERSVLNFRVSFPEHVGVNWVDLANPCKNKFASSDVTVASGMTSPHTHRPLR